MQETLAEISTYSKPIPQYFSENFGNRRFTRYLVEYMQQIPILLSNRYKYTGNRWNNQHDGQCDISDDDYHVVPLVWEL